MVFTTVSREAIWPMRQPHHWGPSTRWPKPLLLYTSCAAVPRLRDGLHHPTCTTTTTRRGSPPCTIYEIAMVVVHTRRLFHQSSRVYILVMLSLGTSPGTTTIKASRHVVLVTWLHATKRWTCRTKGCAKPVGPVHSWHYSCLSIFTIFLCAIVHILLRTSISYAHPIPLRHTMISYFPNDRTMVNVPCPRNVCLPSPTTYTACPG